MRADEGLAPTDAAGESLVKSLTLRVLVHAAEDLANLERGAGFVLPDVLTSPSSPVFSGSVNGENRSPVLARTLMVWSWSS